MFCVKIEFITYSTNPVPQLSREHFVPNADFAWGIEGRK